MSKKFNLCHACNQVPEILESGTYSLFNKGEDVGWLYLKCLCGTTYEQLRYAGGCYIHSIRLRVWAKVRRKWNKKNPVLSRAAGSAKRTGAALIPLESRATPSRAVSPKHYKNFCGTEKEVIDVIKFSLTDVEYRGYLKGNAIKYTCRAGLKGDALVDLEKRDAYLEWLEEVRK